jgi:hypothetical protein
LTTTSPTQIHDGSLAVIRVANTGAKDVQIVNGTVVSPGSYTDVTTNGAAVLAHLVRAGAAGQVAVTDPAPAAAESLELAYAQSTATFTHTDGATPATITGLVINVEAQTGAYYVRVWAGAVDSTAANDILLVDVFDGTSVVAAAAVTVYGADGNAPLIAEARIPAGTGAKTYTARCSRLLGTGTPHIYGAATYPAFLVARRA